jgi:DNA-binding MarR family transcriptional regulator/ribosomal protein S18 acetylase RimI-like enzyme
MRREQHRKPIRPTIRRTLRPGDLGEIVAQHARLQGRNHGHGPTWIEGHVATSVARAALGGFPGERERIWIVEHAGRHAGSVALTDAGAGEARLRWASFDPQLRDRGVVRRILDEALAKARAAGYERITVEAFADLVAQPATDTLAEAERLLGPEAFVPAASLEALIGLPRARILRRLERPRTMGELAGLIASLPSAVTHHVSTLAAAGLVARMRRGRRVLVDRSARGTALLALYEDD